MVRLFITFMFIVLLSQRVDALVINFDDLHSGTVVTDIAGVTFSSNILGYSLVTSDYYATTSPPNALGVGDGFMQVFLPGDGVTLTFVAPVNNVSATFISSPGTPGGVFSLDTASGSSQSGGAPSAVLSDLGEVFSVSFSSTTPFSSVTLNSLIGDVYSFNIDDIVIGSSPVPEPGTLLLLGGGLAFVAVLRRQTRG